MYKQIISKSFKNEIISKRTNYMYIPLTMCKQMINNK